MQQIFPESKRNMDEPYIRDVLRFYGNNESLSMSNLDNLLHLIASRRPPASIDNNANPLRDAEVGLIHSPLSRHPDRLTG